MTLATLGATRRPELPALPPRADVQRTANATLVGRIDATVDLACFRVRPDDGPLPFTAGQYVSIGLPESTVPPRPYSIASCPGHHELEFVISLVPDGTLTSRLFGLATGARLYVGPARGRFRLDPADDRDHLLVATGSGVAPLLAMVSALADRRLPPRTILLHGARTRAELATTWGSTALAADWLSYRPVLSRPDPQDDWRGRLGRVTGELEAMREADELEPARTVAYLCGNPHMIEECSGLLAAAGLAAGAIKTERFTTA